MADAIITRTLQLTVGLREGGVVAEQEVLATYRSEAKGDVFAICREGLLVREGTGWCYIDHADIQAVDPPILDVKTSLESRRLALVLKDGGRVDVPVDGARDKFMDVFPIHAFLRRRLHQHRAFGRKG